MTSHKPRHFKSLGLSPADRGVVMTMPCRCGQTAEVYDCGDESGKTMRYRGFCHHCKTHWDVARATVLKTKPTIDTLDERVACL